MKIVARGFVLAVLLGHLPREHAAEAAAAADLSASACCAICSFDFTASKVVVVASGVPLSLAPSFARRSEACFTIGYIATTIAICSADMPIASGPCSCFQ